MLIEITNASVSVAGSTLLDNVDFHVNEGEFVYLVGKVGSGKSSFLKMLYGELPTGEQGKVSVLGCNMHKLKRRHLPALRKQLGIVFQDFQLLSDRTVYDNIDFVLRATGWNKAALRERRIGEVLNEVGLLHKMHSYPHQLSGGEQQRISIARALINTPRVVLADEPTGNLDYDNSTDVMHLLKSVCERGTAVIMVTHNTNLLEQFPGIVYRCQDGRMTEVTAEYNAPIDMDADELAAGVQ